MKNTLHRIQSGIFMKHAANTDGSPAQTNNQANVQNAVQNTQLGPESRRKLSTAVYSPNTTVPVEIPRDTVIKRLNLQLNMGATVAFASGTCILSPLGALTRLVPNFYIVADGSRNIKVLDLYMSRMIQAYAWHGLPRRGFQTGLGIAALTRNPDTSWQEGTRSAATTEDIVISDSVDIHFQNYLASRQGGNVSLLYTKNLSTCFAYFGFGSVNALVEDGNLSPVVFSAVDIQIVPTIIENRQADISAGSYDYVETVLRKQFSNQTSFASIDLNTGNKLLGLSLMARNGDVNKKLSDTVITDLNLLVNGSTSIQNTTFKNLQVEGRNRKGIGDDIYGAGGTHPLSGFAHMNLMTDETLLAGIDTRLAAGVSQLQLQCSTAAATGIDPADYTNPVELSVHQHQLMPVPIKG